jgi:CubicO group peptidase (beta-lactamase class C family)
MKQKPVIQLLLIAVLTVSALQVARAQQTLGPEFETYVNSAIKEWQVPGVAIAVIKDDKVVFAKGFGVRDINQNTPVDERTLFAIGSSSKAFTTASLAMLVDENKLKWDDPATKFLPGLQLFDPYASRELTVADLVTHRSGLARGDLLWYASPYDRDEILRRARYLKPSWSFRAKFGYQNLMYLAAGQVVASVANKSWDDFIRERIFTPLGMKTSSTSIKAFGSDNVASPHAKIDDKVQPIAWRNIDNIAPAGSINSNVVEMAQWVRLQLGGGVYEGKRLISSAAMKELHTPQTIIRIEGLNASLYPEAHFLNYGMGWFLSDYRGRKVVEHGGAIDGMRAEVAMMPEEKLGLVVLTNLGGNILPHALMFKIFDVYLGAPQRDWCAEMLKTTKGLEDQAKAAEKKAEAERVKGTSPSLALDKYAGRYQSDMYGNLVLSLENGKLVARFGPNFTGDLEHWHYDTFRVIWRDKVEGKGMVSFRLNSQGKVESVNLENLSEFTRAPEEPSTVSGITVSESDLKKLVGKYALDTPPIEVRIELIGNSLKANVPGQPLYTLVPVTADKFRLSGAPDGFFAQFEVAGDRAKSLTLVQGPRRNIVLQARP